MKRCLSLLFLAVVCHGCYYSSWESLEYEAVASPKSHAQAEVALAGGVPEPRYMAEEKSMPSDRFAAFKIGEVMYSVMLTATGCLHHEKGPYTIWLSASGLRNRMAVDKIVKVESIVAKISGKELWRHEGFPLKLNQRRTVNSKDLSCGECKMTLPDILNPKDGKVVTIDVSVECDEGVKKTISFDFRPKISSGKMETLN